MISSDTRSTNPEHFTLILLYWRLPQIILDVWHCLTAGHVDWNEMVDLYLATGVKDAIVPDEDDGYIEYEYLE